MFAEYNSLIQRSLKEKRKEKKKVFLCIITFLRSGVSCIAGFLSCCTSYYASHIKAQKLYCLSSLPALDNTRMAQDLFSFVCDWLHFKIFSYFFPLPAFLFWQEWSNAASWPSWQDIIWKELPAIQHRILGAVYAWSHGSRDQENQPDICDPDLEVPFCAWCHKVTSLRRGDYRFLPESQRQGSTGTGCPLAGARIRSPAKCDGAVQSACQLFCSSQSL